VLGKAVLVVIPSIARDLQYPTKKAAYPSSLSLPRDDRK